MALSRYLQYINDELLGEGDFAPAARGVTNGDSHAHNDGDGAQIAHGDLSDAGTTSHEDIDTHVGDTNNPHSVTAEQVGALPTSSFSGLVKLTVGATEPTSPSEFDVWLDTNVPALKYWDGDSWVVV